MMPKAGSDMRGGRWFAALTLLLLATSAVAAPPNSDPVLNWNEQTNRSIQITSMDPFKATRALALESIAVMDTLRSIAGQPGFMVHLSAPAGVSPELAANAAGHAILTYLFPARRAALDVEFTKALTALPGGDLQRESVAFGEAVATAVAALRDQDGWDRTVTVKTGTEPGQWRPTPPRFYPPLHPQWASVTPFTLARPDQFRPPGPPAPGTKAFNEARLVTANVGSAQSKIRTPDQAVAAHYWSDAIGTYAPAGHWNSIAAVVIRPEKFGLLKEAAVFAELNVAIADAAIAMADAKYTYWSWRPITAIQAGDSDFPARPHWTPLLETPPHPTYVSGHSVFSGAAASVLTSVFGTKAFRAGSASLPGVSRGFTSFQQAAEEAANSRLWGGIHYKFDNDDGLATGRAVGAWAMAAFRNAVHDRGPVIVLDRNAPIGFAFDNMAPVVSIEAVLDDGTRTTIPVDAMGRFPLPVCPAGQHALTLTATSAGGLVATLATTMSGGG